MERLRRKKRQTEKGTREGGNRDSRQTGGGWIQTQKRRDEIILNGRG
jgi:hypothetical protein